MARIRLHEILRSPAAKFAGFAVLLCGLILLVLYLLGHKEQAREKIDRLRTPEEYTYESPVKEFKEQTPAAVAKKAEEPEKKASQEKESETPEEPEETPQIPGQPVQRIIPSGRPIVRRSVRQQVVRTVPLPVILYSKGKDSTTTVPDDKDIAPFGSMLRCELVYSVSTGSLQSPVIGLVTESLWWDGREIIPAGVIVHGTASGSPSRDRIGTGTSWTLVYPHLDERSAYQLKLTGIALDCNRTETGWGESDGTAGIRGRVVSNADTARLMGYIAAFISGMGSGLVSETDRYTGSTTRTTTGGTWKDSLGKALANSAEKIATDMLREAAKDSYYVIADAGTEFYIYVQEVIDPSKAARGKMDNSGNASAETSITRVNRTNRENQRR